MKKLIFVFAIICIGLIACGDDPMIEEEKVVDNNLAGLDCPNVEMGPLIGNVIQLPYSFMKCGDNPYPKGFEDIGGNLTDLENVSGGFIEFSNCNPGVYEGTPVYIADYIGQFVASNKDTVFYEGTFTFDPTTQGEGIRISPSIITGGTGKWEEAEGCFKFYDFTQLNDGSIQASIVGKITPPGVK